MLRSPPEASVSGPVTPKLVPVTLSAPVLVMLTAPPPAWLIPAMASVGEALLSTIEPLVVFVA